MLFYNYFELFHILISNVGAIHNGRIVGNHSIFSTAMQIPVNRGCAVAFITRMRAGTQIRIRCQRLQYTKDSLLHNMWYTSELPQK